MPPKAASKRAGPAAESQSKRTKPSAAAPAPASTPATVQSIPKSKRWAAVSASRNDDLDFKLAVQDVSRANAYICICRLPFAGGGDENSDDDWTDSEMSDGDEDENVEPEPSRDGDKPKCDGGEKCVCQKPSSEFPNHPWILTYGGFRKWISQRSMAAVRCPDFFDMYTFNDHEAYGILEVVENLLLDWSEATTWQEQWIVCEGLVFFLLDEGQQLYMIDDGERADVVAQLIGRLFLTMLARLEAQNLLGAKSAVENLGLIMALYIKFASVMRSGSLLEEGDPVTIARPSRFTWIPSQFDDYINAYATKSGVTLRGLAKIDDLTAELDTEVSLPSTEASWGWSSAFKSYQKSYAGSPPIGRPKAKIGGDSLDITSWTSAERKRYSFDKKDPLSAKMLKEIKQGMVFSIR